MKINLILFWMIAVTLPLSSFAQGVDFKELPVREVLDLAQKKKSWYLLTFTRRGVVRVKRCPRKFLHKDMWESILTGHS